MKDHNLEILDAAAGGALVLTVNKRLARHLLSLFYVRMASLGKMTWRAPAIISFDAWLRQALVSLGEEARLLDGFAALRLWEQAVEDDSAASELGLLQVSATARRAMEAHQLLVEYDADMAGLPLSDDHRAFVRWRKRYLEACGKGGWLDAADLPGRACAAVEQGELAAPGRVLLAGFDELPPRVTGLIAGFSAAGSVVKEFPPPIEPRGELVRMPCTDVEEEVRRAARWVRHLLDAGEERIGIVVPDLQGYRSLVERLFRAEIDPEGLVGLAEDETRFSLSLGTRLSEQGLVVAALEILGAGFSSPLETISFLLRTPYLGGSQAESFSRATLEGRLRRFGARKVSLKRMKGLAEGERETKGLARWAKICAVLEKSLGERGKCPPGEWVNRFSRLLQGVGWPGDRPLGSLEFQIFKAWREKLLPAMVALEPVCKDLGREEALSLLRRLASEIDFQPESPAGPVQVVGILEAAGLQFDHLWVMGLTEDALPAHPRPNPFLPVHLQVTLGMPHASAERELAFARRLSARLFAGAPRVILSHPCREGDRDLRPSPLIGWIDEGEVPLAPCHDPEEAVRAQAVPLEGIVDRQGPPLGATEIATGGTGLLKDQALCPFRAFAHHRLAARALDRPEIGLDLGTRGTLLHTVLERFWERTGDHAALCCLSQAQLFERISECIEATFSEIFSEWGQEASEPLLAIERCRLAALVGEWLVKVERERPAFVVKELEVEHRESFGGLTINTKVDRIDDMAGGSRVILDYKTGRVDPDDLLGERILEPQLPVYGVGGDRGNLAGVAFANVRQGECTFKGVARESGLLPNVAALADSKFSEKHGVGDWSDLLARWRRQLGELGTEFSEGVAGVDPVDPKKACAYCDLHGFCRIDDLDSLAEDAE
ncbi:MAG: hypothetical protein C0617_15460 [Desulfuromonas sp.]|uniref:PD-(D/E)XK nuclease family protein n=1 Tax=Desulfuromonas sp. TaxID=892 RepID=UPI000CB5ECCA|nr:PD-(D/E)XK nuclease family protein [Desulfuromonas sp.]PLX81920.1 MAG: hypothetical protein C0617_15460 [Desulfuromonas sp.]